VTERTYKLDELAHATGMSARTVRYYVQRGLLPPAAFRGKDTSYGHEHLVRLRAIRRLQEAFFPLDAIAVELGSRTLAEIERIAEGKAMPAQAAAPSGASTTEDARAPDEHPRLAIERQVSRVFRRIELFPGVELTVADDAPEKSVRLVSEMLTILEAMSKVKEGGRKR
jgi:DNA-binding transcriptional MerR regulator